MNSKWGKNRNDKTAEATLRNSDNKEYYKGKSRCGDKPPLHVTQQKDRFRFIFIISYGPNLFAMIIVNHR